MRSNRKTLGVSKTNESWDAVTFSGFLDVKVFE